MCIILACVGASKRVEWTDGKTTVIPLKSPAVSSLFDRVKRILTRRFEFVFEVEFQVREAFARLVIIGVTLTLAA